jgi:hypothetical protein
MNIAFFVRHFTARGTEVALFDYARYNEEILHNKSYIICFTEENQKRVGFPNIKQSYHKFKERFPIIEIDSMDDMKHVIQKYGLHFFYTITHGGQENDIYKFNDTQLWGNCNTIKHCVYNLNAPEGDFYISVGHTNNRIYNSNYPVIPHILTLPDCDEDLRDELNIPRDATVFGRHGGEDTFNNVVAHRAIANYLQTAENTYFIFMGTPRFYEHPRIKYLDVNVDLTYKTRFINTCDAMIHAGLWGETFGLSVGEFSLRNKPIIVALTGNLEHVNILGDKAVIYDSVDSLVTIFQNIKEIEKSRSDWNAYRNYSPEKIMAKFKEDIFDKYTKKTEGFAGASSVGEHRNGMEKNVSMVDSGNLSKINRRIFCFWAGRNEMSENRKKTLTELSKYSRCEVDVITPSNLKYYVLPEHPLHEGYKYLTLKHKSQYLKYYFMHFYGGGFSSIKSTNDTWKHAFNYMEWFEMVYVNGSRKKMTDDEDCIRKMLNDCCIVRPNTEFTHELYERMNRIMDEKLTDLKNMTFVPVPHECNERNRKYPIKMYEIDDIFYDVLTKYMYSAHMLYMVPSPAVTPLLW